MRRRLIVIAAIAAVILIVGVTLFRNRNYFRLNEPTNNASVSTHLSGASIPPFATREPEAYQAKRITTFTEAAPDNLDVAAPQRVVTVLLARLGEQRREEYEAEPIGTVVYLENPGGRFVLLPQAKLYADANEAENESAAPLDTLSETIAPDLLLNAQLPAIQYQKLGVEVIVGLVTTKYRVITDTNKNENFVWVDEQLGMPVASRYTSAEANRSTRVTMELRDIRTAVDPRIFVLPADYRKVAASQLLELIRARKTTPAVPDNRK
jgi:hypothetical protein